MPIRNFGGICIKLALKLGAVALAVVSTPSLAVTTFSTNFDSLIIPSNSYTIVDSIEGWNASGPGDGIEIQNHAAGDPFSESNLVELDSNNNSAMSRTIEAGTYKLTFYYSARPGIAESSNGIDVLLNDASIYNVTGTGGATTSWSPRTLTFYVGKETTLTFAATGTSDSLGGYLDNVNLAAGVPEAATWAMMIAGFGFMGAAARRRRSVRVTYA